MNIVFYFSVKNTDTHAKIIFIIIHFAESRKCFVHITIYMASPDKHKNSTSSYTAC